MADIFKNLDADELRRINEWYQRLDQPDQSNIAEVVRALDEWIHAPFRVRVRYMGRDQGGEPFPSGKFFVLYAIGSTITDKPVPSDIDLLLVTDHYINDPSNPPRIQNLVDELEISHHVVVDDQVSKRYDYESDCRIQILLLPLKRTLKKVDITYQYNILSEERWRANDRFDAIPMFRFGIGDNSHVNVYVRGQGWHDPPMSVYRINPLE